MIDSVEAGRCATPPLIGGAQKSSIRDRQLRHPVRDRQALGYRDAIKLLKETSRKKGHRPKLTLRPRAAATRPPRRRADPRRVPARGARGAPCRCTSGLYGSCLTVQARHSCAGHRHRTNLEPCRHVDEAPPGRRQGRTGPRVRRGRRDRHHAIRGLPPDPGAVRHRGRRPAGDRLPGIRHPPCTADRRRQAPACSWRAPAPPGASGWHTWSGPPACPGSTPC